MKPYFENEAAGVRLYHGDCYALLPTIGGVDLLLTDPPYGIAYRPHDCQGYTRATAINLYDAVIGDEKPFDPTPFLNYPNVVLWGANHYASRLPDSSGWLSWIKIGDGKGSDCSDVELAWTSRQMPARRFSHLWRGMIRASEKDLKRVHPTQKPVALMEWCLSFFPAAETVFDPFVGSGTTGVACVTVGRKFIGCDIEEKYCEIAARRIERELAQGRLFEPQAPPQPAQQISLLGA